MQTIDDKEAIQKIQNGEIDYYSYLVNKYLPNIKQFVASKLFDKYDVDDVVQNAFIHFYKSLPRFDIKKPVVPYLFQIVKNELKMYYRSKKQTVSLDDRISAAHGGDVFDFESEEIDNVIGGLKPDQGSAMRMVVEGFSYEEIAKKLNKPINSVRTIIRRARLKLKQKYEKKS